MKKKAPTKGKAKLIPTNIKPTNLKKTVKINYDFDQSQECQGQFEQVKYKNKQYYGKKIKLLNKKQEDKDKKTVAVIVSFADSSSYDDLFTKVEQKSDEGTKVLVYQCDSKYLFEVQKGFDGQSEDQTVKQLVKNIKQVDADCVVFNWQCSAGYAQKKFNQKNQVLFKFLKMILDMGFMAMFSDFSLKALIKQWKQDVLGPNPFIMSEKQYGKSFQLHFQSQNLKNCPSAQLQVVGEMADGGKCNVHTLPGTIIYSLNPQLQTQAYQLQLLTVAKGPETHVPIKFHSTIGENTGTVGHALLKYKSGGNLLTSMGHWIQLMKVDTSQNKLFQIAQRQFGQQQSKKMRAEYQQLDVGERKQYIKKKAVTFVQSSAPCENISRKAKKKK